MTFKASHIFYIVIVFTSVFWGCKDDNGPVLNIDNELLQGNWTVREALRDGDLTRLMDGAYFNIDSLSMLTNLFGEEQSINYTVTKQSIHLRSQGTEFKINKLTRDTLVMSMKRKRVMYQLLCERDTL